MLCNKNMIHQKKIKINSYEKVLNSIDKIYV